MPTARSLLLGLAGAALTATMVSSASADPTPAIKARQAQMQLYGFNLGTLGAMAQEKMPYDAAVASVAAKKSRAQGRCPISGRTSPMSAPSPRR